LLARPEELEESVKEFVRVLKSQGKTPKTINTYVAAVISYYKQGIKVPEKKWRILKRRLIPPSREVTVDKAGTHDEWKRILNHMDVRGRSLLLFLLSTGGKNWRNPPIKRIGFGFRSKSSESLYQTPIHERGIRQQNCLHDLRSQRRY